MDGVKDNENKKPLELLQDTNPSEYLQHIEKQQAMEQEKLNSKPFIGSLKDSVKAGSHIPESLMERAKKIEESKLSPIEEFEDEDILRSLKQSEPKKQPLTIGTAIPQDSITQSNPVQGTSSSILNAHNPTAPATNAAPNAPAALTDPINPTVPATPATPTVLATSATPAAFKSVIDGEFSATEQPHSVHGEPTSLP